MVRAIAGKLSLGSKNRGRVSAVSWCLPQRFFDSSPSNARANIKLGYAVKHGFLLQHVPDHVLSVNNLIFMKGDTATLAPIARPHARRLYEHAQCLSCLPMLKVQSRIEELGRRLAQTFANNVRIVVFFFLFFYCIGRRTLAEGDEAGRPG